MVGVVFPKEGCGNYPDPPVCGGCCRVGSSMFILGGFFLNPGRGADFPNCMWSIDDVAAAGSPPSTWTTVTSLSNPLTPERINPSLVIPYGDRVFILGGLPSDLVATKFWMDVYDTKTTPAKHTYSLPLPEFLSDEDIPYSYFLWKRDDEKNPQIMLDFDRHGNEEEPHRLVSYDVDDDSWDLIDPSLPAFDGSASRCLVPFDSDTLPIIDNPFDWSVYNMPSNTVTHQLELQFLEEDLRGVVTGVKFSSYRRCPLIGYFSVHLSMHQRDLETASYVDAPCAKVELYRDET